MTNKTYIYIPSQTEGEKIGVVGSEENGVYQINVKSNLVQISDIFTVSTTDDGNYATTPVQLGDLSKFEGVLMQFRVDTELPVSIKDLNHFSFNIKYKFKDIFDNYIHYVTVFGNPYITKNTNGDNRYIFNILISFNDNDFILPIVSGEMYAGGKLQYTDTTTGDTVSGGLDYSVVIYGIYDCKYATKVFGASFTACETKNKYSYQVGD